MSNESTNKYEDLLKELLDDEAGDVNAQSNTESVMLNFIDGLERASVPQSRIEAFLIALIEKIKEVNNDDNKDDSGIAIKKATFTDGSTMWEWLQNNYDKLLKAVVKINDKCFACADIFPTVSGNNLESLTASCIHRTIDWDSNGNGSCEIEESLHTFILNDVNMSYISARGYTPSYEQLDPTEVHAFGNPPVYWVDVDDTNYDMIQYYNFDGSKVDAAALEASGNESRSASWIFFEGEHLRNGKAFTAYQQNAFVEFTFTGVAVAWITQFRHTADNTNGPAAPVEVYIDGAVVDVLPANPSISYEGDHIVSTLMWQKTDLFYGTHTVKIKVIQHGYITVDSFSYVPHVPHIHVTSSSPDSFTYNSWSSTGIETAFYYYDEPNT